MINPQQRLQLAPDVVLQVVGGEALLLKLHEETVFALNDTGARIAQLVSEGLHLEAVADTLCQEYGVDRAQVMQDAAPLVETLVARGLMVPRAKDVA